MKMLISNWELSDMMEVAWPLSERGWHAKDGEICNSQDPNDTHGQMPCVPNSSLSCIAPFFSLSA